MNEVILLGRLTKDPNIRMTQQGIMKNDFSIAVQRDKETADFINCVAFGKTAELIEKYGYKGQLVAIKGSIRTGSYENQQGKRVYTTDVLIDKITFLSWKEDTQNANASKASGQSDNADVDYTGSLNLSADDLPF